MTAIKADTSNAARIDPTEPKYQVDKAFPPDKESEWTFPEEHDGWVHAHNTIRLELETIEDCLLAVQSRAKKQPKDPAAMTLQSWEVAGIQQIFDAHNHFVHAHHHNEDDILTPKMLVRVKVPAKLTDDHEGIVKAMKTIESIVDGLKAGDDREESMAALLKEWKPYSANMRAHLQEEEDIGLPLLRAYFTPKEVEKIIHEILKRETQLMMGGFIHAMGKDRFRNEFMKDHGIPFFVWHLQFAGALKSYEKQVVTNFEAIQTGVAPAPPSRSWFGC